MLIDATPAGRGLDYNDEWVPFGTMDNGDQNGSFEFFSRDALIDRPTFNRSFADWMLENSTEEPVRFVIDQTNRTTDTVVAVLMLSSWWLDYSSDLVALNGSVPLLSAVRDEWEALATAWVPSRYPSMPSEVQFVSASGESIGSAGSDVDDSTGRSAHSGAHVAPIAS